MSQRGIFRMARGWPEGSWNLYLSPGTFIFPQPLSLSDHRADPGNHHACGAGGGIIMLTFAGKEPPASLVAVVSGAAGSLSSFLVSVPRGSAGWGDPYAPNRP